MKKLFEQINQQLNQNQDVVLVTIIADSGSTPRGAGARMWVSSSGQGGTIGGGNVEYQAYLRAQKALTEKRSQIHGYNLGTDDVAGMGMVCGGNVVVYFQYLSCQDQSTRELIDRCIELIDHDKDAWLIMDITNEAVWEMGVYTVARGLWGIRIDDVEPLLKNHPDKVRIGDQVYYSEPLVRVGTVYVFGGGHVGQELVSLLCHLNFKCVILDDREMFVSKELFPDAAERILCDFKEIDRYINVTRRDYVVIMTRGHQHDYEVQTQLLRKEPFYLGVMGSRSKIQYVTNRLLNDGYTRNQIETSHMPIGLAIDAETPAEIAVSIAAQLIEMRAHRNNRR